MCSRNDAEEWAESWKRSRRRSEVTIAAGNPFETVVDSNGSPGRLDRQQPGSRRCHDTEDQIGQLSDQPEPAASRASFCALRLGLSRGNAAPSSCLAVWTDAFGGAEADAIGAVASFRHGSVFATRSKRRQRAGLVRSSRAIANSQTGSGGVDGGDRDQQ
jgi:hypothetical protein